MIVVLAVNAGSNLALDGIPRLCWNRILVILFEKPNNKSKLMIRVEVLNVLLFTHPFAVLGCFSDRLVDIDLPIEMSVV